MAGRMAKVMAAGAATVAMSGALLVGTGSAPAYAAVSGCSWSKTDHVATGGCSSVTNGSKWRLGVICSGKYNWSPAQYRPGTVTAHCPVGIISHVWIDRDNF